MTTDCSGSKAEVQKITRAWPRSASSSHSPRTLCDPVHDNRKRGGSDGFLDHAIFGGTTGFRRQKQVVQAMSSLRLFKCWLVIDAVSVFDELWCRVYSPHAAYGDFNGEDAS